MLCVHSSSVMHCGVPPAGMKPFKFLEKFESLFWITLQAYVDMKGGAGGWISPTFPAFFFFLLQSFCFSSSSISKINEAFSLYWLAFMFSSTAVINMCAVYIHTTSQYLPFIYCTFYVSLLICK